MPPRRQVAAQGWPSAWRFHPRRAELPRKLADLEHGHVLLGDFDGHRWFFDPKAGFQKAAPGGGSAVGAIGGAEWTFVSRSGATAVAAGAIGPFTKAYEPGEPLQAAVVGARIVAARSCGALIASDDRGGSWREAGPAERARFVDVRGQADGSVLAETDAKQLWSSRDGERWQRVESSAALRTTAPEIPGFSKAPKLGPSGEKLRRGEASWNGKDYFEVEMEGGSGLQLRTGSALELQRARALSAERIGCAGARIASFEQTVYVACGKSRVGNDDVVLYRSDDAGQYFWPEPYALRAKLDELRLAAGADGALVLSGACEDPKCEPEGIFHRERAGRRLKRTPKATPSLAPMAPVPRPAKGVKAPLPPAPVSAPGFDLFASTAPPFSGPPLALVASPDGKQFAALATTLAARHFVVLRSIDGGRTFLPTPVPELVPSSWLKPPRKMDGHAEPYSVMSASFDDLGNVAFVLANEWIVMARYDGVVSVRRSPHLGLSLGAYGPRVLAVDTNGSRAWESSDAGATWRSVAAPLLDCSVLTRGCSWGIHCDGSICFIGDDYTRTTWDTPG